jgi:hypothetical protein
MTINLITIAKILAAELFKEEVVFNKKQNLFIQNLNLIIKYSTKIVFIKIIINKKELNY